MTVITIADRFSLETDDLEDLYVKRDQARKSLCRTNISNRRDARAIKSGK